MLKDVDACEVALRIGLSVGVDVVIYTKYNIMEHLKASFLVARHLPLIIPDLHERDHQAV